MARTSQSVTASDKESSSRAVRINRLSTKKAQHDLELRQIARVIKRGDETRYGLRMVLSRRDRKRPGELMKMIAYDFETTLIQEGTPKPLYITAFSEEFDYCLARRLDAWRKDNSLDPLRVLFDVLQEEFLVPRFKGCSFVAWNGNNFDVYLVALALLTDPEKRYVIRPYLTKGKSLRGLRIILKEDLNLKANPNVSTSWEFLDGISMLGLQGKSLKDFLKTFAPEYQKLERESFEEKEFDPDHGPDIEYAIRDSEGLYYGMQYAQEIIYERFRLGLRATMGNLGIKIFETRIPEDTKIVEPKAEALSVIREFVVRGGYCHLMRKYKGPVWKYDLNQAYAAAMREAELPAGDCGHMKGEPQYAKLFVCRITATNSRNRIPFYCRELLSDGRILSAFATTAIHDSWITSSELAQLRAEKWSVQVHESWCWYGTFNMAEYVTALETLRRNAPGGPSGAVGTMIKQIGNNSYGKTLEQLEPLELVLSSDCPPGFVDYYGRESPEIVPYVWCRLTKTPAKKYHQPQIGAFITAHVRMVVRRAALLAPASFLYADTDCVIFSKDVTRQLDIDSSRYGAFKLEAEGADYMLIAKKVYASGDFKTKHSKGLAVKELSFADFVEWYEGRVPVQRQAQRQNFVKVMRGENMFVNRTRKGTAV